jgi:hypothetical protein
MKLHNNNSFFFYNTFALDSPSFPTLRSRKDTYVDKTDAIAELLSSDEGMYRTTRIFFARPRKFGKSLTLDVAAEMLSAGALPHGVTPWPGYIPVELMLYLVVLMCIIDIVAKIKLFVAYLIAHILLSN